MVMFADDPVMGWEVFVVICGVLMAVGAYTGYWAWTKGAFQDGNKGGGY